MRRQRRDERPVDGRRCATDRRPGRAASRAALTSSLQREETRMKLSVIGCGYLGAVHAAAMAELGHEVIGIDVDPGKIEELRAGRRRSSSPGLPEVLASARASGRLRFSTDIADAADATVHFVAVGTPQSRDGHAADLTYVDAAIDALLPHLKDGRPRGRQEHGARRHGPAARGTRGGIRERRATRLEPGVPARGLRREGHDRARPARLRRRGRRATSRCSTPSTPRRSRRARPRIVTNFPTAELVKVAANAFLATKISFINAMAEIAEATDADVTRLADAIGHDARIGRRFLNAGRRIRRRLPPEGHPGVHGAGRGARPRRVGRVPQGGRRDQPPAAPARRGARA